MKSVIRDRGKALILNFSNSVYFRKTDISLIRRRNGKSEILEFFINILYRVKNSLEIY